MKFYRYIVCAFLFIGAAIAETININWINDNETYAQTTCEIGGDVILPTTPTKRGHTFVGWLNGKAIKNLAENPSFTNWYIIQDDGEVSFNGQEVTFTITKSPTANYYLRGTPRFNHVNRYEHIYFISYELFLSKSANNGGMHDSNNALKNIVLGKTVNWNTSNIWQQGTMLATQNPAGGATFLCWPYPSYYMSNWTIGDYYKIRNYKIYDLTEIFGAGNEPTTPAEAEKILQFDE